MDAKYCFPNEVLEKVFWYLDGISLTNCRMTCRRWNEIISNLECRSLIWKARCLEMNEDILQELLGNKTPDSNYWNEKSKVDNDFWRRVYVKNYKSTYLHKLPCIQKNIFMGEDNQVTCVRITGNCLITGHTNGRICIWNSTTGHLLYNRILHFKSVTVIELIDLNNWGNYGTEDFFVEHHHMVTGGKDRIMKITAFYEGSCVSTASNTLSGRVDCIRAFGKFLCAKCHNGEIYIWEISLPSSNVEELQLSIYVTLKETMQLGCCWMTLWNEKVICIMDNLDRYEYNMKGNNWVSCYPPVLIKEDMSASLTDVTVKACFLFRKNITILITVNNYVCISADGKHYAAYSTSCSMSGHVVCVKVCGHLIAFGTNTGRIYMYYFKEDDELLNLNLETPTWMKKISDVSIIAIDIWLMNSETVLIASSKETSFVVRWSPTLRRVIDETA